MPKSKKTLEIEQALVNRTREKTNCYGVLEVTIGHIAGGKGYDRCDYVEFDTSGLTTCYEIKVSFVDLLSKNKLSYVGDKNYLVVTKELADRIENSNYNLGGVGLIVFNNGNLSIVKKASKKTIGIGEKAELLEGIAKAGCRDATKYYVYKERIKDRINRKR